MPILDAAASSSPTPTTIGNASATPQPAGTYDNELLDAHYIAGDGRVNENIGLTAVHSIFHSEHNRLVDQTKDTVARRRNDLAFLNEWLLTPGRRRLPDDAGARSTRCSGTASACSRSAKFGTEMQYQHLVFEEFARTIQPNDRRVLRADPGLRRRPQSGDRRRVRAHGLSLRPLDADRDGRPLRRRTSTVVGDPLHPTNDQQLGLIAAFLNPLAFAASGPTPEEATGAIVRGVTRTGRQRDRRVRHRGAAQQPARPAARSRRAQHRARPRRRHSVPERGAARILRADRRQPAQALHQLGRPGAASEAPGIADQLHRRLRHARRHHAARRTLVDKRAAATRSCSAASATPADGVDFTATSRPARLPQQHRRLRQARRTA